MNLQAEPTSQDSRPQQASLSTRFPEAWNVYCSSFLHPRTCLLGEHKDDAKYALHTRSGKFGRPAFYLHAGPTKKDAKLAAVKHIKYYNPFKMSYWIPTQKNDFNVLLPPKSDTGRFKAKACDAISVTCPPQGLVHRVFQFSLDIPGLEYTQFFEWRHSRGEEVMHLQSAPKWLGKLAGGWKLVWLNPRRPSFGVSNGRGEVVAVWADATFKGSKLIEFEYVNSGKGQLGEQFMLVAAATGIEIWQIEVAEAEEQRQRQLARAGR